MEQNEISEIKGEIKDIKKALVEISSLLRETNRESKSKREETWELIDKLNLVFANDDLKYVVENISSCLGISASPSEIADNIKTLQERTDGKPTFFISEIEWLLRTKAIDAKRAWQYLSSRWNFYSDEESAKSKVERFFEDTCSGNFSNLIDWDKAWEDLVDDYRDNGEVIDAYGVGVFIREKF